MTYQLRQGTTAQWGASTRVMLPGELGFEYASVGGALVGFKAGDGVHTWPGLQYIGLLDSNGKVPTSALPNLALIQFKGTVASQTAMLATAGELGDWVIRSDTTTAWIITGGDPTQLANWTQLPFPSITWSNISGKPAFVAAGVDAASARAVIGAASTSSVIGTAKDFGTRGDAILTTAAMTAASGALTKTSGSFTSADVGKKVVVQLAGATRTVADAAITTATAVLTSATAAFTSADVRSTITVAGAGAAGGLLTATIVKVSSSTTVTLSVNASTTVSAASITLKAFLTTSISSVTTGVATLANVAGSTVSGVSVLYGTDDTTAIQAAITAAAVAGGTVILPPGNYITTSTLTPASNVTVRGVGAATALYMASTTAFAAFSGTFSVGTPLTGFALMDMTIDGAYMQTAFNVGNKAVFIQYLSGCVFLNLTVQNTLASGLGIDFLTGGTLIHDVRALNCGAGSWGGSQGGGSAGIGIGTGQHTIEEFTISDCHASGNGTFGIFIETQPGTCSLGMKIIGCSAENNQLSGFCDAGGQGAQWIGCWSYNNLVAGFTNCSGTVSGSVPGQDTLWSNCVAWGNGQHGFSYSPFKFGNSATYQPNAVCRVSWKGCKAAANGSQGFFINTNTGGTLDGLEFDNCESYANGSSGLILSGSGTAKNVVVTGGAYYNNATISSTDKFGLRINCNATNVNIKGVKAYDDNGTQKQTHGLGLTSGFTVTGLDVEGNDLRGNLTGPISTGATLSAPTLFRSNFGYNPVGSSVPGTAFALAATTVAWTNNTGVDVALYVTAAGTVTAVSVNGVAVSGTMAIGNLYRVPSQGTFTVTYSVAPTLVAVGD